MLTYTIRKDEMTKLVETLKDEYDVYGPIGKRTSHVFARLDDPSKLDLEYDSTIMSPKKYFTPSNQVLMRVGLKNTTIEDTIQEILNRKPRILLGVHSCDINGINFLNRVFGGAYNDPYYEAYREITTIVGLNCLEPCKYGFCRSVNKNFVLEGYDLYLTDISNTHYYVHVGSPRGDRVLTFASDLFKDATEDDNELFKAALRRKHENLPVSLHIDNIHETLDMSWDDEIWDELGTKCMNCGSCALVCPTCYCFDVNDRVDLAISKVERTRKWDTCLFYDFALVAGNHNFREDPPARLKYRFYHKFRGAIHEQGEIACTGCGRCIDACPAGISIKDVLFRLQEYWAASPSPQGGL
ncbi:MAG: 4Fe-4S dicluster domain-containing protein [Candidatus Thorarchaeota archaeon]